MTISDTFVKRTANNLPLFIEAFWPMLLGALAFGFGLTFGPTFFTIAEAKKWHIDNIYISIFSFLLFVCPLIFSSFIFIKTLENRFVSVVRASAAFARAEKFAWRAVGASAFASVATIPFMVVIPAPTERSVGLYLTDIWFAMAIYAISLTVRSAYNIASILEVADPNRFKW